MRVGGDQDLATKTTLLVFHEPIIVFVILETRVILASAPKQNSYLVNSKYDPLRLEIAQLPKLKNDAQNLRARQKGKAKHVDLLLVSSAQFLAQAGKT